jgi:hypothetical protein
MHRAQRDMHARTATRRPCTRCVAQVPPRADGTRKARCRRATSLEILGCVLKVAGWWTREPTMHGQRHAGHAAARTPPLPPPAAGFFGMQWRLRLGDGGSGGGAR